MVDDPLAAHLAAHYDLGFERDRLFREGEPRLELTRTLELLDRFLLDGLWRGWLGDPLFRAIAERDLVDGQHRNPDPARYPQWFTTAYFHRPEELVDEVRDAGFDAVSLLGVEGPGWLMQEHWSDPDRREQMLLAA